MNHLQNLKQIQELRESHTAAMIELGITEEFISALVETFYDRIRQDSRLGPIFNGVIGDNWGPHLAKMKMFWSTIILKSNKYSGKPVPAHQNLSGVRPGDFDRWLNLFEETLNEIAPHPDVTDVFMGNARTMATRLESVTHLENGG